MLVRGCAGAGGELRHSLAERTKALAAKCHALRSPALPRESRSADRRRIKCRKSQTRWYVKRLKAVAFFGTYDGRRSNSL
ncbi:jg7160 [Pararge aegeria aegeria]|uniref:Jg7160 protein n=1 Tax=Pararge aegeria aegeria TaxID=348720 RepID=A0A8S4R6U4_9NEOP|nr:jg7160 [Pararge aegeria aegeria]